MALSADIWRFGYSKPSVTSDLIQNILKTSKLGEIENWYFTDNIKCKYK